MNDTNSNNKKPHNRIAEIRKEKHLTLQQVADAIGVGNNTISRYETGKREPKLATWKKMADFFGVSVSYLQGFETDISDYNPFTDDIKQFNSYMDGRDVNNISKIYDVFLSISMFNDGEEEDARFEQKVFQHYEELFDKLPKNKYADLIKNVSNIIYLSLEAYSTDETHAVNAINRIKKCVDDYNKVMFYQEYNPKENE